MSFNRKPGGSADSGPPIGSVLSELPPHISNIGTPAEPGEATDTVLLFVSTYCSHCIDLLPYINAMTRNHPSFSFRLLSTGDEDDHRSMIEYFGWTFPVCSLDQGDMEAYFAVMYLPFAILVDDSGKVAAKGVVYNADDFEQLVKDYARHALA
ncbi:TlpA family protein disulfide reductase [Paenibacillus oleatilyticus]|uniref:TlpA family protein disulfide reductase n=1 Tax=Paenibacillus oleatilyticus TaxID=2594886 RepID=A0ABV4UWZ4_9BACL